MDFNCVDEMRTFGGVDPIWYGVVSRQKILSAMAGKFLVIKFKFNI